MLNGVKRALIFHAHCLHQILFFNLSSAELAHRVKNVKNGTLLAKSMSQMYPCLELQLMSDIFPCKLIPPQLD